MDNPFLSLLEVAKVFNLNHNELSDLFVHGKFISPSGFTLPGNPVWHVSVVSDWVQKYRSDLSKAKKNLIPVIYVAGPYRASTRDGIDLHIQSARNVAIKAAQKGWAVICPHTNTAHMEHYAPELGDQFWLDATLEMMRRCDAVVLAPGWANSQGALAEIEEAERIGMPVFEALDVLPSAASFVVNHGDVGC